MEKLIIQLVRFLMELGGLEGIESCTLTWVISGREYTLSFCDFDTDTGSFVSVPMSWYHQSGEGVQNGKE